MATGQLIKGNILATPTANTTAAQYAAAQSQGFSAYSGGSAPTTPSAPNATQTPPPATNNLSLGGKSYDVSTPDGLKTYQTDLSKVQQPQNQQVQTAPQVGEPALQNQSAVQTPQSQAQTQTQSSTPDQQSSDKYNQGLQTLGNKSVPDSPGAARAAVSEATGQYQSPQQAYQPSPQFMQTGDPIMQSFVQAAMKYQDDVIQTGYTAKTLQTTLGNQVQGIDLEAASLQNIMNGTRDDIRAEINKAGGFATESQIEGLVTTRNRDLLKQYNNLELQKQTMQNQMNLQVGLAQADHQYAEDKFNNITKTASLYKGIYDNATDQVDKLVQNVGYSGLAAAYNYDPYTLSIAEQHMNMPLGTLSNPQSLAQLETYRQKTLNLSNARFGATYGYQPGSTVTNNYISSPGGASYSSGGTPSSLPGGGDHPESNPNVPYDQYGLLSHTNFDPKNTGDKNALNYLNTYLNGKMPQNGGDIGISIRGAVGSQQYQSAVTRANDLYFAATGQNLPSPEIIKSNMALISANNQLSNNLKIQENTVNANFGLSLQNLNANNLNSAYPILNGAINNIKNAEGDPAVAQYFAQNSTIQQELGNLLAVKNAAGTTVYDKIAGAGLLPKNATPAQQVQVVKTLLQEAKNASGAFKQVNGELYQQVDPLERQTNNPNRQSYMNSQVPSNWVKMTGPKGTFNVDPKNVDEMKKHGYK